MPKRYYTVDEVNALLPQLDALWTRIIQLRGHLKTIYQRLEQKKLAPQSDDFDPVLPGAPPDVQRDRFTFRGLVDVLKAELASVGELGCQVKDVETGLVDWLGQNGDREVLLCWRFGERSVGFFHDVDAGFSGRKPISELRPPVPLH